MLGKILSFAANFVVKSLGGGIFSSIARFASRNIINYINNSQKGVKEYYKSKNLRESFHISLANYGDVIPLVFGNVKIEGKIIWLGKLKEYKQTTTEKKYFTNVLFKQVRAKYHLSEYSYYCSFALLLCEGEISEIGRVWFNDQLIDIKNYKYRLYFGSEKQMPDPLISQFFKEGNIPAFRSLSYIVFEELPLGDFDNLIPKLSFEILRKPNICASYNSNLGVENLINSIVIIPASGEFVYDTEVQYKIIKDGKIDLEKKIINANNYLNIADSLYSLNQLQIICPNVNFIAVTICWFADNLDIKYCNIIPAVEFCDKETSYSEEWKVADYNRFNARLISRDQDGYPRYGGTVNDISVIRYLKELKKRSMQIMFYPIILLDIEKKPWRGHISGEAEYIKNFFHKKNGYNNFILHYANLVKDYVDVFIIGSELVALNAVQEKDNSFPAVNEFITLAKLVKNIMGEKIKITYAADWSEYHHTKDGWYHLDDLFASPDIDFIGIDAYFPVTNIEKSPISASQIEKGLNSGEGFDYYIDQQGNKKALKPEYAWKNIRYWWENHHYNPNGQKTKWTPKMKKIWFTEFGFPSIDKATNQPNIFFDPFCSDGGAPKYSSGNIDFSIQRTAIKKFCEFWQKEEYIEKMFLWAWDARPYPAWPHYDLWRDGYLWEKGHWVNNKLSAANITGILAEISYRVSIEDRKIKFIGLDEPIKGLILTKLYNAYEVIELLRISYLFDLTAGFAGDINFIKRGYLSSYKLDKEDLIKLNDSSYFVIEEIAPSQILAKLAINYLDENENYNSSYFLYNNENFSNKNLISVKIPIVMTRDQVELLSKIILNNAASEDRIIKFKLSIFNLKCQIGDLIKLELDNFIYFLRIINIHIKYEYLYIEAIWDDGNSYYVEQKSIISNNISGMLNINSKFIMFELPFYRNLINNEGVLPIVLASDYSNNIDLYVSITGDFAHDYVKLPNEDCSCALGIVISFKQSDNININDIFLIDETSRIIVYAPGFNDLVNNNLNWHLCLCGKELIKFRVIKRSEKVNYYEISSLMRGYLASEKAIYEHKNGENIILLDYANIIHISENLINNIIYFKFSYGDSKKQEFQNLTIKGEARLPCCPFITHKIINNENIIIKWIMREKNGFGWSFLKEEYNFLVEIKLSQTELSIPLLKPEINIKFSEFNPLITLNEVIKINIIAIRKNSELRANTEFYLKDINEKNILS